MKIAEKSSVSFLHFLTHFWALEPCASECFQTHIVNISLQPSFSALLLLHRDLLSDHIGMQKTVSCVPDPNGHTRRGVKSQLVRFGWRWKGVERGGFWIYPTIRWAVLTYWCLQIKYLVVLDVVCAATTDLSALRLCGGGSQQGLIALWRPEFTSLTDVVETWH